MVRWRDDFFCSVGLSAPDMSLQSYPYVDIPRNVRKQTVRSWSGDRAWSEALLVANDLGQNLLVEWICYDTAVASGQVGEVPQKCEQMCGA